MTKNINIELSEEDFEELKKKKERMGLTWEGVLKEGVIELSVMGESTGI